MPKRNNDSDHYDRVISDFNKGRKRLRIISSSDSEHNSESEPDIIAEIALPNEDAVTFENKEKSPMPETIVGITECALDPEILAALGEATEESPKYGQKIHNKLAQLWLPILRKGLKPDAKEKLLKQYPVPENCTLLQAPKLNAEISAAVSDVTRNKDKRVEAVQQQIGLGITALNRGLTLLLENASNRLQAITLLCDSCRILCDVHHNETEARKKFVTPGLDKAFLNIITDVDRDETLFGNKLSEKIKASRAIEKQGSQIKKSAPAYKAPSTSTASTSTSRPRYQGNWTGPPRYPSSAFRGGARESQSEEDVSARSPAGSSASGDEGSGSYQAPCNDLTIKVHAGRIQSFFECWLKVTDNPVVLKWISEGFSIPFCSKVEQRRVPANSLSRNEEAEMLLAINNLLSLGAVSVCERSNDDFISPIFLAPKSNGGKRFILNLKSLNKYIPRSHFKMEDHRTAAKLIPKDGYLSTIDLKEAYLLVPIHIADRKYLRFMFKDQAYEFNALPYGLSEAPRVFTKIMKEVITFLRNCGHRSVIYLDDILCIGDTYSECMSNVNETLGLLRCLGFVVNLEKSVLKPHQTCKFLGFVFDTTNLTISLPTDKRNRIAQLALKYSALPTCSIREFSQLIGVLVAACPAVKYGWLYTKTLERQKYIALLNSQNDFDAKIKLPADILPDLQWWQQNIHSSRNSMRPDEDFFLEVFSDASRTGWGAYCQEKRVNGGWKDDELTFHINYLELLAVFMGLKCFARDLRNCAILLRVDNTTAISYINRMGGIQFTHLNDLSKSIWQWCEKRDIWLFASYINTKDNVEADQESRKINHDTEWELADWAFQSLVHNFGQPKLDLFASRTNAKCKDYVSWKRDPEAVAIDAFTINWTSTYFYAFPPFALVLKCLRKIQSDQATGILVFPYWPGQPWFPLLKRMLRSKIVYFTPKRDLLRSRYRSLHPMHKRLTLGAAKLSGSPSHGVTSQRQP